MPPTGISYGDAKSVLKGEDNHVVLSAGASCFAVFDGHGGTKACKHGVDALAPAILALGVNASTNAIEDAFWEADAGLGGQTTDGSTATILLCDNDGAGGLSCVLMWVGDSVGCVADLAAEPAADCLHCTTRHSTEDAGEEKRLQITWQLSRALRLAAAESGGGRRNSDPLAKPTPTQVKEAATGQRIELSDAEAALLSRAIERGNRIDTMKFGEIDQSAAMTSILAPRVPGGKAVLHKVDKEGAKEVGADGLAKALTSGDKVNSVSTAVTRAIGDWDGSRALVPHPEVLRFTVAKDQCLRCVLASDGLWDFLTTAEACKLMRRGRSPQACADKLVEMAVNRSKAKYNGLKDDTTAIVIELNPSGEPPPIAAGADGSACCVVS